LGTQGEEGDGDQEDGNNFYLYKVTSVWDKDKGRAKKTTQKFLGTITPDGLVEPRHERMEASLNNIAVKEFGATNFLLEANDDIKERLKALYPDTWKELFIFAVFIRDVLQTVTFIYA